MRKTAFALLCAALALALSACPSGTPPSTPPDAGALPDGGNGSPDSGVVDGGSDGGSSVDESDTLSPRVRHFFRALEQSVRGEPADLDGDGTDDLFTETLPDGTERIWTDGNEDGVPDFVSERSPTGGFHQESDANEDGQTDAVRTFTVGNPSTLVTLEDEDFDGHLERRETLTYYAPARDAVRILTEADEDMDGVFTVVSDVAREPAFAPLGAPSGDGCDAKAGVPTQGATVTLENFRIYTGDGAGFCDAAATEKLKKGLQCALDRARGCLSETNRALSTRLATVFRTQTAGKVGVTVACGNTCDYKAVTWSPTPGGPGVININPAQFANVKDVCALMLHEVLHLTHEGLGHDKNQAFDRVFSCGRYCGGCSVEDIPADSLPLPGSDCTRCAGTSAEKRSCGTKRILVSTSCPDEYTLCHAGIGGDSKCESCKGYREQYCDNRPAAQEEPDFRCCATCPSGYDDNDQSCAGVRIIDSDTCANVPGHCK